ncbi:MgtC/SapB family protein [Cohnella hongkongensis]|uniref:MgtC/SapB family protein n=1 Tax=Cohnella hongkongensis TaxID=178337 RepID=A0ABV9FGA2_9BACL
MNEIWLINDGELALRIALAAALGGLIGLEREWNNHAAGLRTHIMVCLGSAAIMLLSIYGFSEFMAEPNVRADPARLAAQVVSGIGFLGAGAILRTGSNVSGLTTAASIWVVAAIGLCTGAGFFYCAVLTTAIALLSLFLLNKLEKWMMRSRRYREVKIKVEDRPGNLGAIIERLSAHGIQIGKVQVDHELEDDSGGAGRPVVAFRFHLKNVRNKSLVLAMEEIKAAAALVSWESDTWMPSRPNKPNAYASPSLKE